MYLRQSTAATVEIGPFVGTDGLTESTALSSQTGRAVKAGTSSSLTPSSWTHQANGNYAVGLSTSHTDTVGRLRVQFQSSANYLPVWRDFVVLHAAVYDVLFGSTAPSTYAGGAVASVTAGVTVATNNDKAGYSLSQAFPANFASLGINASGHVSRVVLADTLTTYTGNTPQTGDAFARIGANGAGLTSLATAAALSTLATTVGAAGAGLTAIPDPAGVGTLLTRITSTRAGYLDNLSGGPVALASQIPADFTSALFASAGVFSSGALANAPTGGGGGGPVTLPDGSITSATFAAGATLPRVTLVDTVTAVTGHTPQTGDAFARIGVNGAGLTAIGPVALTTGERASLAAAILDLANGVESGETVRQTLRLIRAVLAGEAEVDEDAGTVAFLRKDGSTVALTVTHDATGNRTASTAGSL